MRFYPLLQLLLYQAAWFACILGGAAGRWDWGVAAAALAVGAHVALTRRWRDLVLVAAAAVLGAALDSALGLAGLCRYGGSALAPAWMIALWAAFAPCLTASCAWLVPRPALALALGAIGGPLAYAAGERLGAVAFPAGWLAGLAGVAVEWMAAMLGLTRLALALERRAHA